MKREAKEMRLVYRDFLLDVNKSHPEVVALDVYKRQNIDCLLGP